MLKGIFINKQNKIKQVNKKYLINYLNVGWNVGNILNF